ncbi:diguanylate cyclase domain-containing protein [Cohnella faecalis]|uniref:Diguanylate cyclase n=1 Tax=Cohnella faecalis TaxID=2315694 RepID=A0A398CF28_9BACL|nr:diguanylate cyclase [Cohnella faecalis]RIE01796.1 diguanylate cyclase [Cohnella faecalis]
MRRHLFLMITLVIVLAGCAKPPSDTDEKPKSFSGRMDLTDSKMKADELVDLNGEWAFYWRQLLEPKDLSSGTEQRTGYIDMPSNWYKHTMDGDKLPRNGFATFALQLRVSDPDQVKGLILPVMYSNYKLWVDDRLVAVSGQVGTDRKSSIPQKSTRVVYFHPQSEQVQLLLQISNYHNYAGGMWEPIVYGSASVIQNKHDWTSAEQYLLLGIIFLSGIYHIGLGSFHKKDSSLFLFGVFCLVAAIRNTTTGVVPLTKLLPNFPWEIGMKLEYITLYLMVLLLALFIQRLFPEESLRRFTRLTFVTVIIYSVLTMALNADQYYRILIYFQLFMAAALLYAMTVFVRATLRQREGAFYAMIGFSVFMLTAAFDLFRFLFTTTAQIVYSLGVVTFIVCFSFVLSKKLAVSFKMTQQLADKLVELNEGLDKKVRERTFVIEESNKKLEKLNRQLREWSMVDGLTGVSNRRHFDDFLSSGLAISREEETPLTLLLLDIDNFKRYNDQYGHIQGDFILQEVAQAVKSCLVPEDGGLAARYGGEEFAVVLPRCGKDGAERTANNICEAVRQLQIPHVQSEAGIVTVSIGAATVDSDADKDYKKLIELADRNLYKAKSRGKNRVCFD